MLLFTDTVNLEQEPETCRHSIANWPHQFNIQILAAKRGVTDRAKGLVADAAGDDG